MTEDTTRDDAPEGDEIADQSIEEQKDQHDEVFRKIIERATAFREDRSGFALAIFVGEAPDLGLDGPPPGVAPGAQKMKATMEISIGGRTRTPHMAMLSLALQALFQQLSQQIPMDQLVAMLGIRPQRQGIIQVPGSMMPGQEHRGRLS